MFAWMGDGGSDENLGSLVELFFTVSHVTVSSSAGCTFVFKCVRKLT